MKLMESTGIGQFKKLHNDLIKHFKKMNIKKVYEYGPEISKYNDNIYDSELSIRSKDKTIGSGTTAFTLSFNLHYNIDNNKTELFVPFKGEAGKQYFNCVPTVQKILNSNIFKKKFNELKKYL